MQSIIIVCKLPADLCTCIMSGIFIHTVLTVCEERERKGYYPLLDRLKTTQPGIIGPVLLTPLGASPLNPVVGPCASRARGSVFYSSYQLEVPNRLCA